MDDQKDISAKYWLKFSAKITSGVSINSLAIQFFCQKCNVNHANIMWFLARHRHDQGETEIEVDENRKINCVATMKGGRFEFTCSCKTRWKRIYYGNVIEITVVGR